MAPEFYGRFRTAADRVVHEDDPVDETASASAQFDVTAVLTYGDAAIHIEIVGYAIAVLNTDPPDTDIIVQHAETKLVEAAILAVELNHFTVTTAIDDLRAQPFPIASKIRLLVTSRTSAYAAFRSFMRPDLNLRGTAATARFFMNDYNAVQEASVTSAKFDFSGFLAGFDDAIELEIVTAAVTINDHDTTEIYVISADTHPQGIEAPIAPVKLKHTALAVVGNLQRTQIFPVGIIGKLSENFLRYAKPFAQHLLLVDTAITIPAIGSSAQVKFAGIAGEAFIIHAAPAIVAVTNPDTAGAARNAADRFIIHAAPAIVFSSRSAVRFAVHPA